MFCAQRWPGRAKATSRPPRRFASRASLPCVWALALIGLSIALPWAASAQPVTQGVALAAVEYNTSNALQLRIGESADQDARDVTLDLQRFQIWLQVPVPLDGKKSIAIPKLRYESLVARAGDSDSAIHLKVLDLRLSVRQALGAGWAVIPSLNFGFASDLAQLRTRDFFGGASLVVTKRVSPSLSLGAGAGLAVASDGPLPVPVLILKWTPRKDVWLSIVAPSRAEVAMAPLPWLEVGLAANLTGLRYTLSGTPTVESGRYANVTAGAMGTFHLGNGFHVRLDGGVSSLVQFKVEGLRGGPDVHRGGGVGWFARAALQFRVFPLGR